LLGKVGLVKWEGWVGEWLIAHEILGDYWRSWRLLSLVLKILKENWRILENSGVDDSNEKMSTIFAKLREAHCGCDWDEIVSLIVAILYFWSGVLLKGVINKKWTYIILNIFKVMAGDEGGIFDSSYVGLVQ